MTQHGASDSDEVHDPLIGQVVNERYEIVKAIAQGGMGRVYRARQVPLGRVVALKVLQPNYHGNADPGFHRRFFLEAATLARLKCPNTVTVFDYGSEGSVYYIAMECLEGRTLHRELRRLGHLPIDRTFSIARQMCRSLGEAHELGIIHRDLKPANIFLVARLDEDDDGGMDFVKIIDFGLVKELDRPGEALTKSGLFMGSPKYMSPEQIRNHELDARSDIYSIGIVLYEMLTGRAPFVGKSDIDTLTAHLGQQPPPMASVNPSAAVPPAVEDVVRKALAKSPEDRYANVEELHLALRAACTGRMSVTPTGPWLAAQLSAAPVTPSGVQRLREDETPTATKSPAEDPVIDITFDPGPRRGVPWLAVALLAVAVAGIAGAFALGKDDEAAGLRAVTAPSEERPREEQSVAAPAPPPEPDERAPAEPVVPRVLVRVTSDPAGAHVVIDQRLYGPTPAQVELVGESYSVGSTLNVQFQKEGYRDRVVAIPISGQGPLDVSAELEAIVRRAWRPRPPASSSEAAPTPSMWSPI